MRAHLLQSALVGLSLFAVAFLALSLTPWLSPRLFPWDSLGLLALCGLCWGVSRWGNPSLAASWLVAGINILATFEMQFYGTRHPVTAVFLLGIVLAGMLIGGWFLRMWVALGAFFVGLWTWFEFRSEPLVEQVVPPATLAEALGTIGLWWTLFVLTGWLVWLFASNLERFAQVARGQATALTRTINAFTPEATIDTLLSSVVQAISQQLGASYVSLVFCNPVQDKLLYQVGYGEGRIIQPNDPSFATPPPLDASAVPIWQDLVAEREPILVTDIANETRLKLREQILADGIQTILYVPLLFQEQTLGFFSINSLEKRRFRTEEVELARALAQHTTLALQLKQLAQREQETAVLEERNRIARDIHDTLAQSFTGIVIQLETAEDALEDDDVADATGHIDRARDLARLGLTEARRSVHALRPAVLTQQDLAAALEEMVTRMTANTSLAAEVIVMGEKRPLRPAQEETLLRIGQEALTNVMKHAQATQVMLTLTFAPSQVSLRVRDDGVGLASGETMGGYGLVNMRERAESVNGRFAINQPESGGTEIVCVIPTVVFGRG